MGPRFEPSRGSQFVEKTRLRVLYLQRVFHLLERTMRRIFLVIFSICILAKAGFCDTSSLKLSVDPGPPIVSGEQFYVTVRITNTGTDSIKLIESNCPVSTNTQWISDNPDMLLTAQVCVDHFNLPDETWRQKILLNPGQSYECKVWVYDEVWSNDSLNQQSGNLIRFKLGLKEYPDSEAVWSEQVSIPIKKEEVLPVTVKAFAWPIVLPWSVPIVGGFPVDITLINTSTIPQTIWVGGVMTDNEAVHPMSYSGCFKCTSPDPQVTLQSGESYKYQRMLAVSEDKLKQNPLRFRAVSKTVGYLPVYSNPIFIFVLTKRVLGLIMLAVISLVLFRKYISEK
jgi:hypothetical protein